MEELDAFFVPALHSVGAPLAPGQQDVAVALQRHQVHRPVPRGADDLVLRLGLRRQRPAGQEVLLAAHRLGHRPRRGLARRAHAHPQADQPREAVVLRRGRLPQRVRQDQPGHARPDRPRLGGADPRRRHRLDEVRCRRPPVRREPRVRLLRRRARHQREDQPQRHAHDREGQLGLHQRRPDRRTATSGGRAWRTSRPTPPTGRATPGRPRTAGTASCPATPTAATAPRSSSARSSPPSTTTRRGSRSRPSSSAAAARPRSRW